MESYRMYSFFFIWLFSLIIRLLHVSSVHSLLLLGVPYFINVPQFIYHSPVARHLGCFQRGTITNKTIMNIRVQIFL